MSHFTPICYCCYDREEMFDDDDLADYDEGGEQEMIELWLEHMEEGQEGCMRPLADYIKGAGADALAKSPELRARVLSETRLYLVAMPSEEGRAARMEIYHAIRALRAHNPNWVE